MFASSPEELETLLEDAVLLGDEMAVAALFDKGVMLITGPRIIGPERALADLAKIGYAASTRTVTVRRDLVVGDHAVKISIRAPTGPGNLSPPSCGRERRKTGSDRRTRSGM